MVIVKQGGEKTQRICVVTRGGVCIGVDASISSANQQSWVCKEMDPLPKFDLVKEKQTYREVRKQICTT